MITVYMTTAKFTMLVRNNIKTLFSIAFGRTIYFFSRSRCFSVKYTNGDKVDIYNSELEEKFEDRKWVISSRKSKKERQY